MGIAAAAAPSRRLTRAQRDALVANLELERTLPLSLKFSSNEVDNRIQKLQAQCQFSAQALRTKINMRLNRVPKHLWNKTFRQLAQERQEREVNGQQAFHLSTLSPAKKAMLDRIGRGNDRLAIPKLRADANPVLKPLVLSDSKSSPGRPGFSSSPSRARPQQSVGSTAVRPQRSVDSTARASPVRPLRPVSPVRQTSYNRPAPSNMSPVRVVSASRPASPVRAPTSVVRSVSASRPASPVRAPARPATVARSASASRSVSPVKAVKGPSRPMSPVRNVSGHSNRGQSPSRPVGSVGSPVRPADTVSRQPSRPDYSSNSPTKVTQAYRSPVRDQSTNSALHRSPIRIGSGSLVHGAPISASPSRPALKLATTPGKSAPSLAPMRASPVKPAPTIAAANPVKVGTASPVKGSAHSPTKSAFQMPTASTSLKGKPTTKLDKPTRATAPRAVKPKATTVESAAPRRNLRSRVAK